MLRRKSAFLLTLLIITVAFFENCSAQVNDRFAGLHFDFHAQATDTTIGKNFSPALIDSFLKMVKPDYIQVDSKGDFGYSSYPTAKGKQANGIKTDILAAFRKATLDNNVDLYVHYSSLIDKYSAAQHPEWLNIKSDGSKDAVMAYGGGYTNNVMLPQLKELETKYKINGVWLDDDAWVARLNYSPEFQQKFKATYHLEVPKSSADASYGSWLEFNRQQYLAYFKSYVDELHAVNPDFRIMTNYAYSSYMPLKPEVDVYLSDDIRGKTPYQAAFEGRCFAAQNKPWDLMSWAAIVRDNNTSGYKSLNQMEQEAGNALALGGGFETYWFQRKDGSLPSQSFKQMAQIIAFCKERKEYCFNNKIVPQIGLFYSYNSWKDSISNTGALFSNTGANGLAEMMKIMIDEEQSVDIIMQHELTNKLNDYPVIIIPEWNNLGSGIINELLDYVNNGGNLIVSGAKAVKPFASAAGVSLSENVSSTFNFNYNNQTGSFNTNFHPAVVQNKNINALGTANISNTNYPLATISAYGKGKIALVYFDVKDFYSQHGSQLVKNIFNDITTQLFASPIVKIVNASNVEQVVTTKNNHLFIQLVNMSGKESAYNATTPVQSFTMQVSSKQKPSSVLLQPGNTKLNFTYNNNVINISVPGFDVYSIVQID